MRVAVVGHVEWIEFLRVARVPHAGEIAKAREAWEEPGGGGAVAAAELARLAGSCLFLTALGDDERGWRSVEDLERLGIRVEAAFRPEPQRRGVVFLDDAGERTITVIEEKMHPAPVEPLPWDELARCDAVYLCAGTPEAVRAARAATVLVATARELPTLRTAAVVLDALVTSATDDGERYTAGDLDPPPRLVARTEGTSGGSYETAEGGRGRWAAAPLEAPLVDAYGAGDSFAAALAYGLAAGLRAGEALTVAARSGARALTRRGAHGLAS